MKLFNRVSELSRLHAIELLENELKINSRLIEINEAEISRLKKENERIEKAISRLTTETDRKVDKLIR